MEQERQALVSLNRTLQQEQEFLRNRHNYDKIAESILTFKSRHELLHSIDQENAQIAQTQRAIQEVDGKLEARYDECRALLASIHDLLDNVNGDIKNFKT